MSESTELQQTAPCGAEKKSRSEGFHLEPLDGLRFFAALWVALHHGRKPVAVSDIPWFHSVWDGAFFGVAGVLAFFVLSGICIHFPTASSGKPPRWGSFLIRRYIRVLLPYWVILPLATLAGKHFSILQGKDVAWTLLCELGFYLLYPLLYLAARSIGWLKLCLISAVSSLLLVIFRMQTPPEWGAFLNIFIFLPCWLMGCIIAQKFLERVKSEPVADRPSASLVYTMRAVVIVAQGGVGFLTMSEILYHRFLSIPLSAVISYWIWTEMCFYFQKTPSRWIAWAGTWSYSMYLMHQVVNGATVPLFYKLPSLPVSAVFVVNTLLIFVCSYLFALCIEWPSQRLARAISKRVKF